jgi:beta-N-acetylhexosaminidase
MTALYNARIRTQAPRGLLRRRTLLGAILASGCAPALLREHGRHDGLRADAGGLLVTGLPDDQLAPVTARALADGWFGGVVLFRRNLGPTPAHTVAFVDRLRAAASRPILVAVDQEGGAWSTVGAPATAWPAASALGEHARRAGLDDACALASARAHAMGLELAALGVDVDLAPVLDLDDPAGAIGARAFSSDADEVTALGGAFADGLATAGVLAAGKHFPGHGTAVGDSHRELPRLAGTLAELEARELVPFARLAGRLPMIMTGHLLVPGFQRPATLEPGLVTGLLRERLGFQGVIVTDDLGMAAVRARHAPGQAAVAAVRAGCDLLLFCHEPGAARAALAALVDAGARDGALRARIREASARLARLRGPAIRPPLSILGCQAHVALALDRGTPAK